ncbi:MAG TPA: NAD(P)-dependent oxidoreductase [Thermoanaerobaculia bacterium]|nr:NAD(P)-dependent oxidoreductase [Thermoanaerobaculia bacterium]
MRVLVADKFERSGLDGLAAAGCTVVHEPDLSDRSLVDGIARHQPEVLVVRGTKVTAEMLDAGPLSLVVRAGAGVNSIDVAAASARGIHVANCPGKNAIAVAELAIGLLLALDRRIPDAVADLRARTWNKKEYSKAAGLFGKTLGVLGLGSIGCETIRRAHALGMRIVAWSRRFAGESRWLTVAEARELGLDAIHQQAPIRLVPTPAEIAAGCDALTVHLELTADTQGLVSSEVLGRLRAGALFVNTARAEIVDADALEAAVREKGLRVGLDVFRHEPAGGTGEFSDPIVALPNVYGTHHVGASTEQAQEAIAAETVRIVRSFVETGRVPNCVNLARRSPATHRLVVRHRDRPGVLAHVFDRLREAGINVQETENVVFDGAQAALARIHLDRAPDEATLAAIRDGNENILDLRSTPI